MRQPGWSQLSGRKPNMKSFQIRPADAKDCPEILCLVKVNFFFLILWSDMALVYGLG